MSPRLRRVLTWVGYPLYALVALVLMIYFTFPYERVRQVLEARLSTPERQIRIGALSARPLLSLSIKDVLITLRPKASPRRLSMGAKADGEAKSAKPKVHRLRIEEINASLGLMALIGGGVDADFSVRGLGGKLSGNFQLERKGRRIKRWGLELEAEGLGAKEIPQLQSLGPPLLGTLGGKVKLEVPLGQLNRSSGEVDLEVANATFGDNKGKIKIKGNPMLAMGVTLPRIRLGRVGIKIDVKKGKVELKQVGARSDDMELSVDGGLQLRKPMPFSTVRSYVKFKISQSLIKRNPTLELLGSALSKAKRSDGFYGLLISGILRAPRVTPSRLGLGKGAPRRGRFRRGAIRGTRGPGPRRRR